MRLMAAAAILVLGLGPARAEVQILRGSPAAPPRPVAAPPAGETRGGSRLLAGERLWIVDGAESRVTVCRPEKTTQAGVRRLRCLEATGVRATRD